MKKHYKIEVGGPLNYVFDREQLTAIEDILERDLMELGVHSVFLIDMAGNIIADKGTGGDRHDIYSLAALAAGNFGAVSTMAKLIGEEEFSLLYHRGQKESIHFSKVTNDFLPIEIGKIKGFDIRVQLYTVPGQVKYDATRRLVLRGADGIVFVADSLATLERDLNTQLKAPSFAASAQKGPNVVKTMKKIIVMTMDSLRRDLM